MFYHLKKPTNDVGLFSTLRDETVSCDVISKEGVVRLMINFLIP